MKNISMKIKAFIAIGAVLSLSTTIPKPLNGPGKPKVLADANTNRGIVSRYTSFEVIVPASAIPLSQLYTSGALTPNGKYSATCPLDFTLNSDNTIDAMWQASNATNEKHISRISLTNQSLVKNFLIPAEAQLAGTSFLGYESLENDKFLLGYSDTEATKAYYTCFDGNTGQISYTTELFQDPNVLYSSQPTVPAYNTSAIVTYNKVKDAVSIYFGRRTPDGHQAGFFVMFNGSTGAKLLNSDNSYIGRDFNYSHLMDQRVIPVKNGTSDFYSFSQPDVNPSRQLIFTKWSTTGGRSGERLFFFDMRGTTGVANQTWTRTGDFLELPNGDVAALFATSIISTTDYQGPKNVKLVIITNTTSTPTIKNTVDLSAYTPASGLSAGTGAQLQLSGQNEILVGWNVFNNTTGVPTKTSFRLVDYDGNITSATEDINEPLLYHAQSMQHTGGSNDRIVFVSAGSTANSLKVNLFAPESVLPITLTKLDAKIDGNQLNVNWTTASENNNHHFEIEVSKDGKSFKKVGEDIVSKGTNGNSTTALSYTFTTNIAGALAALPFLLLAFTPGRTSRRRKLLTVLVVAGVAVYGISCKKDSKVETSDNEKVYVRVAQVDIDGTKAYTPPVVVAK